MTPDLKLNLRLHFAQGLTFGRGKADLLEAIDRTGSISGAGREMKMSYRRAWNLVEEMNTAFAPPLIDASRGGSGGGGAALTDRGREVLAHYRALERLVVQTGAVHIGGISAGLVSVMHNEK